METYFEIGNITINEPVTVLTDLVAAAVSFYAFFQTKAKGRPRCVYYFKYFFLLMALATSYGGIVGHGFIHYLSHPWKVPGWIFSMFSIMLIERGAIMHSAPLMKPTVGKIFAYANIVELTLLLIVVLVSLNFFFVEAHGAYGLMVVVFSLELYVYVKTKSKASSLLLTAVFFAFISAVIHLGKVSPHVWFNHIDLSHILMALSMWYVYSGVRQIK